MKTFTFNIALWLALLVASDGDTATEKFRVACDGIIQSSNSLGRTTWTGKMSIEHPRFRLELQGRTSLFSGPTLSSTKTGAGKLRTKDLTIDHEWISLVALGDIKVAVIGPGANPSPIAARRFVYIPGKDQILIDGKPWKAPARTEDIITSSPSETADIANSPASGSRQVKIPDHRLME